MKICLQTQSEKGSGIGLAVVKEIILGHGGSVRAENREGLAMIIHLPIAGDYDASLLDVMFPGKTGFDVCRELRRTMHLPIIMVTAKKEDIDKIRGLGLGTDDYLVKPFSPAELVVREKSHIHIHSLLLESREEKAETEITYQNLIILPKSRMVYLDNREVVLVNKEFELLLFMVENPNIVFSKDTLFDRIWGMDSIGDVATVTVHINRLRDKLGQNSKKTQFIETVWGAGYRFRIAG